MLTRLLDKLPPRHQRHGVIDQRHFDRVMSLEDVKRRGRASCLNDIAWPGVEDRP